MTEPSPLLVLHGDAASRGRAQGHGVDVAMVRSGIRMRLGVAAQALAASTVKAFLAAQQTFCEQHCEPEMAEVAGIAAGFDLSFDELFAFLHLGVVADIAGDKHATERARENADGCSVWAIAGDAGGLIGKNRDYHGEHAGLQRVFRHCDPDWGMRELLCVGSLGAPGAYSSGINSDGLAVADTQVATRDHGTGWLRYFTMTRLLRQHATVASALADLRSMRHVGGGALVLADESGETAAVDLGHRRIHIEFGAARGVARTNHYVDGSIANAPDASAMRASSKARLARLERGLDHAQDRHRTLRLAMRSHDGESETGLCRHGQDGDARTLSASVLECAARRLHYSPGNPCETPWVVHELGD